MMRLSLSLLPLLAALAVPAAASAQSATVSLESKKFLAWGFDLGGVSYADSDLEAAYGDAPLFIPRLTLAAVPWSKYVHVEVRGSIGFVTKEGTQLVTGTGAASADKVQLGVFPLGLELLVGLDIVHEQPVVPYGGVGLTWVPWRESEVKDEEAFGLAKIGDTIAQGDRFGFDVFFGGAFLLDVFEPARMARLDARSGVNDVFLTVEGRYQDVKLQYQDGAWDSTGLDFSGWGFHIGLKFVH